MHAETELNNNEKLPRYVYVDPNGEYRSLREDATRDRSSEPWEWPSKYQAGDRAYTVASVYNGSPELVEIVRVTKTESGCVPLYHVNMEGRNPTISTTAYTAEQLIDQDKIFPHARLPRVG